MSIAAPVPLRLATAVADELARLLEPACERIIVAGSIRRLRPYVHDIELLAIPKVELVKSGDELFAGGPEKPFNLLWEALDGFLEGRVFNAYIRKGDKSRSFRWPIHERETEAIPPAIQVDLSTTTKLGWGWMSVVRTGAVGFSKHVASCLKFKGFIGHEGRVYHRVGDLPRGDAIGTPSESDVFRLAGMAPVEPAERSWG